MCFERLYVTCTYTPQLDWTFAFGLHGVSGFLNINNFLGVSEGALLSYYKILLYDVQTLVFRNSVRGTSHDESLHFFKTSHHSGVHCRFG